MKTPVEIKYIFPISLAAILMAACDANHDGDKGAVWGTDKQDAHGSAVSTGPDADDKKQDTLNPHGPGDLNAAPGVSGSTSPSGNQSTDWQGGGDAKSNTAPTGSKNYGTQGSTGSSGSLH